MNEGKVYFTTDPIEGYSIRAVEAGNGDALVTISKDGATVREFLWPAYKVWNVAAHADEIIQSEIEKDGDGLATAGSDGLGGGCVPRQP